MKTLDYLDAVKDKLHLPSDYALAKELGMTRSGVSFLRNQKGAIGEETAVRIAKILEIDPIEVMVAASAERSKNPEIQRSWETLLEKISKGFETLLQHVSPRQIRI